MYPHARMLFLLNVGCWLIMCYVIMKCNCEGWVGGWARWSGSNVICSTAVISTETIEFRDARARTRRADYTSQLACTT